MSLIYWAVSHIKRVVHRTPPLNIVPFKTCVLGKTATLDVGTPSQAYARTTLYLPFIFSSSELSLAHISL